MKKAISLILTAALALSSVCALADTNRNERVYVVVSPDGTVQSLNDNIRLMNEDELEVIEDRSSLKDIRNLSGKETFTQEGESLIWQANGNDIIYEGSSDRVPAVLPVVTFTLDGQEVTAEEVKNGTGDAVMSVTYQLTEQLPALAVTVMPLPDEGMDSLTLENATVLSEVGRNILIGWAVPGLDADAGLPASFSVAFHADHADLGWMMTFITSDPIERLCNEVSSRVDVDAHTELDETAAILTAIRDGLEMPETTGKTRDLVPKITELNDGLTQLEEGASSLADAAVQLADGAASLMDGADSAWAGAFKLNVGAALLPGSVSRAAEGAESLSDGLTELSANNETLNQGAEALFAAVLSTANDQLKTSGLTENGMTVPELTAENYAEALDALAAQLDPEALKASAAAQVEAAVREQVEAGVGQIREAVEAAVQGQVLEGVLAAAGLEMSAEDYENAVMAGQISQEVAAGISQAVEQEMASETVQNEIGENVKEQAEQMIRQNTEQYLETDETIAAQLASAEEAAQSLSALKGQLDQIAAFVSGLKTYTDGVRQASEGASSLKDGLGEMKASVPTLTDGISSLTEGLGTLAQGMGTFTDGMNELRDGAAELHTNGIEKLTSTVQDAEKKAAEKLLPYVTDDLTRILRIFDETRDQVSAGGYDISPEGMQTSTVYIIRTDLQ